MNKKKYSDYYPNYTDGLNKFQAKSVNVDNFEKLRASRQTDWAYLDSRRDEYINQGIKIKPTDELTTEYLEKEFRLWRSWSKAGKNIFDFSENLIELLKDTDVSDLDIEFIKLPYPCFYIDLTAAKIPFTNDNSALINGVYIKNDVNDLVDDETTYERVISLDFTGPYIENFKSANQQFLDLVRGFHSYSLYLDKPYNITKVGEAVKDAKDMFMSMMVDDLDIDTKLDFYKIHSDFIERTIKLTVNCLLYLSLQKRDVSEKFTDDLPIHLKTKVEKANTKRRKEVALDEIKRNGFTKIKFVGHSIESVRLPKNSTV